MKINIYKPYLSGAPAYVGGKSKNEIVTSAEKIFKLSSNENALGSSPRALQAIKNNIDGLFEYPDRTDVRVCRALDAYYKNELSADHFIATPSGSELIDLIIRAFVSEGLECIACNPAFQPYFMFSKNHGARTIDVPLIGDDYELNVAGILNRVNENTRLIFITSPNNPTGTYIDRATLSNLIDQLPDHVILVLDEVYHHFVDADDYSTAMEFVKKGKQIIGLNSFSKAYGLAGLRVGYAYGPVEIMTYIRQLCKPFLLNTLATEAAIGALADVEFIAKIRKLILSQKEYLYQEFSSLGLVYWKTQGNFIMVRPPMNEKEFETRMIAFGIMTRPVSGTGSEGCVRITIGTEEANRAVVHALRSTLTPDNQLIH